MVTKIHNTNITELTVLTVDDCSVMRTMIERVLHMMGLNTNRMLNACNGLEAMQLLEENSVDLVILDINMPVMDGMEVLDELDRRTTLKDIPVLIVTTESNEKRIHYIESLGAGFVHKPFRPETLRNEILKVLSKKVISSNT